MSFVALEVDVMEPVAVRETAPFTVVSVAEFENEISPDAVRETLPLDVVRAAEPEKEIEAADTFRALKPEKDDAPVNETLPADVWSSVTLTKSS
jgi:hypothetical protein